MLRSTRAFYVFTLLASLAVLSNAARTNDPFYVIAHMTNSRASLDWAVREGANSVEMDIKFDDSGNPTEFEHGGICDCTCPHPGEYHICNGVLHNDCSGTFAKDDAREHLQHLARLNEIALVIMDGKVDSKWGTRLQTAGRNVIYLLEQNLFARGYQGKVVVSAGNINCYDYVYSAAQAAAKTPNANRYYFAFDQEGNNYNDVAEMLARFTRQRVFGTGITTCWFGNYESGISQAVNGVRGRQVGMSYIWTLDKESSMDTYIELGVQGVMTNRPGLLKKLALSKGLRLATTNDPIPISSEGVPFASPNKCDCDYHRGGCTISLPAPRGRACRCRYKGFWTCGGGVVDCSMGQEKCLSPDGSREACQLGGGDCGGY